MTGQLGLEGMTNQEIREMHEEWAEEEARLQRGLAKRYRWMERDDPWRRAVWKLLEGVGFGYEDAYRAGYRDGEGDGRIQESKRLGVLCDRLDIPCYFGRFKIGVKV